MSGAIGPPFISSRLYAQAFTVTNGTLGPVLWCPCCDQQIGHLADHVSLAVLITEARHHIDTEHPKSDDD